jgi:NTP pyrophosphatase (non-canonical NTP hydrolase)
LGEAADAWKKGLSEEAVAEELVDVVFHVLDASRLACPSMDMDEMFWGETGEEQEEALSVRGRTQTSGQVT